MDDLVSRDLQVLWHPATHFQDQERLPPLPIARAHGVWLETTDGHRILDAISSWWTCLHGHGHRKLVEAVREQVATLDHVMFAGFTHAPAVQLAEALLAAAPVGYGRVFYADCGSAAIEVALKLSYQSRLQTGAPARKRFAALSNGYHGETLGALAVCGPGSYRDTFAPLLAEALYLPVPSFEHHTHGDLDANLGANSPEADAAVALLEAHAHELTALVMEPLVQCAGRMRMTGSGFYRRLTQTAQALGIHVIADEIAVAFGRTGRLFASQWCDVTPDLLCLSKGLSGGILPLAAVLVRAGLDAAFTGEPSRSFLHSHTFTGNPIACAAGVASLELLHTERLPVLTYTIEKLAEAAHLVRHACPWIRAHRQTGMMLAFEVAPSAGREPPLGGRVSLAIREAALARGLLLRPLHDVVYWMPPLCIASDEIDILAMRTIDTLQTVFA